MIRRQLLRQLRANCQSLSQTRQPQPSPFSSISSISPRATAAFPPRIARRWQSTETEKVEAQPEVMTEKEPSTDTDKTKQELEAKSKEVIDLKDKYLRSVADFRNLQDRTKRDMDSARQFAIQRFATDMLDSIDNLDRALSTVPPSALGSTSSDPTTTTTSSSDPKPTTPPNPDLLNLHSGLKMTESILLSTLSKHGLDRFDPSEREGKKFDPNTDEATFFAKQEGKQDGEVFYTQSKGYMLNGRVIRAAKVGVVKNS